MKLFRGKPKPPLAEAANLVAETMAIVHRYHRDRSWRPSAAELRELEAFADSLFARYATVQNIARKARARRAHEDSFDKHWACETSGAFHKRLARRNC